MLLPSRLPPHRSVEPRASVYHRFAMAALAGSDRGMLVSDLELRREGPSYTALTLEALHCEGYAPSELFFITGSDAFAEISTWHDYPRVLALANFVVVSRPGHAFVIPPSPMNSSSTSVIAVEAQTPDVSSTEIRRRAAAGSPIDHLVGPAVADHICRHKLYAPVAVEAAQ
jgi:nicotinate-nucleotide adenylyltransferase